MTKGLKYFYTAFLIIFLVSLPVAFLKSYNYQKSITGRFFNPSKAMSIGLQETLVFVCFGLPLLVLPSIISFYSYKNRSKKMSIFGWVLYLPLIALCSFFGTVGYLGSMFYPMDEGGLGVIGLIPIVFLIQLFLVHHFSR